MSGTAVSHVTSYQLPQTPGYPFTTYGERRILEGITAKGEVIRRWRPDYCDDFTVSLHWFVVCGNAALAIASVKVFYRRIGLFLAR